jgi:hypothetical protein
VREADFFFEQRVSGLWRGAQALREAPGHASDGAAAAHKLSMQANPRDRYGGNSVPRDAHVVPRAEDAVCAAEGLPRSHALLDEESMMYLPPLVSTLLNSFCKDVTDQHTSQSLRQHHTAERAVAIPAPSSDAGGGGR